MYYLFIGRVAIVTGGNRGKLCNLLFTDILINYLLYIVLLYIILCLYIIHKYTVYCLHIHCFILYNICILSDMYF